MRVKGDICPVCGQTTQIESFMLSLETGVDTTAWSCGYCRHAWRTELWEMSNPKVFFGDAEYTKVSGEESIYAAKKKLFERFLDSADKAKPQPPRLMVDFGCSYGHCMQMFKEHGWDIMGIEISPTSRKILNERNLPNASNLEDSDLSLGSVDVVVMADSIYYLPDPITTLRTIRSYMRPEGLLFLRQPTRGGLACLLLNIGKKKTLSRLWIDHIHLFSRKSTALTLEHAGFRDIQFFKEKDYRRSLKGEVIHRLFKTADIITMGFLDLALSWTVVAKTK